MPLSTNAKIVIAVGVTAAVGLMAAAAFAAPKQLPAPAPPPTLDVYAVIDKAAKYETDLGILRDLRDKVLAASQQNNVWDPYWQKLQARIDVLAPGERGASAATAGGPSGGGAMTSFRAYAAGR